MADKKDKVDTDKPGYRNELRKRAVSKAMNKKPEKSPAAEAQNITDNVFAGLKAIEEYFEGAAKEVLS